MVTLDQVSANRLADETLIVETRPYWSSPNH